MPVKKVRAKINRKGRNPITRFVLLPHYLLRSVAWKTMSSNAKALLIEVWRRHNGINNGEISYAVSEAKEIGMTKSTAARSFAELIDRGFLKVSRESVFTMKNKLARTWILTAERHDEDLATKDFMRWAPKKCGAEKTKHGPTSGNVGPTGGNNSSQNHGNERKRNNITPHGPISGTVKPPHGPTSGIHLVHGGGGGGADEITTDPKEENMRRPSPVAP